MNLNDFIFNYRSNLKSLLKNKDYISFIKRIFLLPFKYSLSNLRNIFVNKNIDKIDLPVDKNNLDDYFKFFNCDKSSLAHGYDKFYLNELEKYKNSELNILEFGIHYGASQASFKKYFPKSNIIAVDKNPYVKKFFSKKIKYLYCDVSNPNSLEQLKNYLNFKMDVIIDDASHIPEHQLKTFAVMFDLLKNNGIYIVEELDIFQSYPEVYSNKLGNNFSIFREILHDLKDNKNLNYGGKNYDISILKLIKNIEWVKIFRGNYFVNNKNISEIAFIKKK